MAVGADEVARAVAVRVCVAVVVWRFQRRDSRERGWRRDGGMDRSGSRGNASVIVWEGSSRYGKQGGGWWFLHIGFHTTGILLL